MRTIASVALAAIVAATTINSAGADWRGSHGGGYYPYYRHHDHDWNRGGWNYGGWALGGLALGLTLGALAPRPYYYGYPAYAPPPPPPYPYSVRTATEAHIDWCRATYNTYQPETNLWSDYNGAWHACVGPY